MPLRDSSRKWANLTVNGSTGQRMITEKSSLGLDANVAAALTYGIGWVTGIAFLLVERESQFVRFHAFQSTIAFGALCIIWMVSLSVPLLGWLIAFVVLPLPSLILWLFMMYKAYQGERFKLPIAGDMAEQQTSV
jgi:uncharacterized membrane protein